MPNFLHIIRSKLSLQPVKEKGFTLEILVGILIGLWMFLIPFGKGEKVPVMALALVGAYQLIRTKGRCATTDTAKRFLLLLGLYLIPIVISLPDAATLKYPLKVLTTGLGSGLAGLAVISLITTKQMLQRITLLLAAIVGFWFLDAGFQALFHVDIFGLSWEEGRLSGPFLKKTQMGYYSGPFSAILLFFAIQKKWNPLLLWGLFAFTSVIVLLNNSRGGWILYAVVAAVFIWKILIAPRKHKLVLCTFTALLGIALLAGLYGLSNTFRDRADQTLRALQANKQDLDQALTFRLQLWEAAWGAIEAHPINGSGARNFRVVGEQYWPTDYDEIDINTSYPHQFILEYLVGTGLIGVLGWLLSAGLCIRWWRRATPQQKQLAMGYGLVLASLYFPLNTHKAYYSSEMAISIWMILSLYTLTIHFDSQTRSNTPDMET